MSSVLKIQWSRPCEPPPTGDCLSSAVLSDQRPQPPRALMEHLRLHPTVKHSLCPVITLTSLCTALALYSPYPRMPSLALRSLQLQSTPTLPSRCCRSALTVDVALPSLCRRLRAAVLVPFYCPPLALPGPRSVLEPCVVAKEVGDSVHDREARGAGENSARRDTLEGRQACEESARSVNCPSLTNPENCPSITAGLAELDHCWLGRMFVLQSFGIQGGSGQGSRPRSTSPVQAFSLPPCDQSATLPAIRQSSQGP